MKTKSNRIDEDLYSFKLSKPKKPLAIQRVLAPKTEVLSPYSMVNRAVVHHGREILIGEVEDYYAMVHAVATTLKESIELGDRIVVRGAHTEFMQEVQSIQENRKPVKSAKRGKEIGLGVEESCRKGDKIFKVV